MARQQAAIYSTSIRGRALSIVSIADFRETLKILKGDLGDYSEDIYSYWNNKSIDSANPRPEEVLHIRKKSDGSFYLEIGNMLHHGSLAELEEKLFEWARDEGWLA